MGATLSAPVDTDGDSKIDALESNKVDTDNDGVVDELDADNTNPANDSDDDGLSNIDEKTLGTNPLKSDTDNDGENDKAEVGVNPASPLDADADNKIDAVESILTDTDKDGVVDELDSNDADPNNDSDGDGYGNMDEKTAGTNPLDKTSKPNTAPKITSGNSAPFAENATGTIIDIDATDDTDSEGAGLTYQLDNSVLTDNALFNLDGTNGKLTFKVTPDYELPKDINKDNSYIVMLKACDSTNTCTPQVLIIAVSRRIRTCAGIQHPPRCRFQPLPRVHASENNADH